MTTLLWFTNDLRIHDNQALYLTSQRAEPLVCIYCVDEDWLRPDQYGLKSIGERRWQFLHESLQALNDSLHQYGQRLFILQGSPVELIGQLIEQYKISALFSNRQCGFYEHNNWQQLKHKYPAVKFTCVESSTLFVRQQLEHITEFPKTFSKFRHCVDSIDSAINPLININTSPIVNLPPPLRIEGDYQLPTVHCKDNELIPKGGEKAALKHLIIYFSSEAPSGYEKTRNELEGWCLSTKFSYWLANGSLSPRTIIEHLIKYEKNNSENKSTRWIYFELLWREYFQWYAYHYGNLLFTFTGINHKKPLTSFYPSRFKQWCLGNTPYPIVNACMNQLNDTGYLSNRGRQIVASCLVNELSLDWRCGAAYFEQQLIDYDVASNWGNWQYIAGVGCDPRGGRHFNLHKQAMSYDPQGKFIDAWRGQSNNSLLDSTDAADWPITE